MEADTLSPIKAAERAEKGDAESGQITSLFGTYQLDENGNEIKVEEPKPEEETKKQAKKEAAPKKKAKAKTSG